MIVSHVPIGLVESWNAAAFADRPHERHVWHAQKFSVVVSPRACISPDCTGAVSALCIGPVDANVVLFVRNALTRVVVILNK